MSTSSTRCPCSLAARQAVPSCRSSTPTRGGVLNDGLCGLRVQWYDGMMFVHCDANCKDGILEPWRLESA